MSTLLDWILFALSEQLVSRLSASGRKPTVTNRPQAAAYFKCSGNQKDYMQEFSYCVVEVFEITGRGAVAVVDDNIKLNAGKPIHVKITRPDGAVFDAVAFVELFLRRESILVEKSALLLQNIPKDAVPVGSMLALV